MDLDTKINETRCINCGKLLSVRGEPLFPAHVVDDANFPLPLEIRRRHQDHGLAWARCSSCLLAATEAAGLVCKHAFARGEETCNQNNLYCAAPACQVPRRQAQALKDADAL